MQKTKPFYKSYIVWLAAIPMLIEIINLVSTTPFVPENYRGLLTLIAGILTIVARSTSSNKKITIN